MTACGFKNALISQKVNLDPSWPSLDDCNTKKKKTNERNFFSNSKNKGAVVPDNRSSTHAGENDSVGAPNYMNEDFPALSSSSSKTKHTASPSKCSNHIFACSNCSSNVSKCGSKSVFKQSKLKHGSVNVPLLSLVKVRCEKKRKPPKNIKRLRDSFCGNKLDSDKPLRKKGKVRLFEKKYQSRLKQEIVLSRRIKNKQITYTQYMLKLKHLIPSLIKCHNEFSVDKLGSLLESVQISDMTDSAVKKNCDIENKANKNMEPLDIARNILHSNGFRAYCSNIVNESLLKIAEGLVITLRNFQDRMHYKDPSKAFAKRRYVCGFKESKKFLLADRVKLIIIATNLQLDTDLPSGRVLEEFKTICQDKNVPLVYAGRGNQIGYWTLKRRRISIVSILNYEGAEEAFLKLVEAWENCKKLYQSCLHQIELSLPGGGVVEEEVLLKNIEEKIRESILSKLSTNDETNYT